MMGEGRREPSGWLEYVGLGWGEDRAISIHSGAQFFAFISISTSSPAQLT